MTKDAKYSNLPSESLKLEEERRKWGFKELYKWGSKVLYTIWCSFGQEVSSKLATSIFVWICSVASDHMQLIWVWLNLSLFLCQYIVWMKWTKDQWFLVYTRPIFDCMPEVAPNILIRESGIKGSTKRRGLEK